MTRRKPQVVPIYHGTDRAARERLALSQYPGLPPLPCIGGPIPGTLHGGKPGTRLYVWVREADLETALRAAQNTESIDALVDVLCVPIDDETRPAPSESVMLSELVTLVHADELLTAFYWEGGGRWPEGRA